jgi:hypothetical protein
MPRHRYPGRTCQPVDLATLPGSFPVTDDADRLRVWQEDSEHLRGLGVLELEVTTMSVQELLPGFRVAEVIPHLWRVGLLQETEVGRRPCPEPNGRRTVVHAEHASPGG